MAQRRKFSAEYKREAGDAGVSRRERQPDRGGAGETVHEKKLS